MKFRNIFFSALLALAGCACGGSGIKNPDYGKDPFGIDKGKDDGKEDGKEEEKYPFPKSRNMLQWPFKSTSIWNIPIGSNAQYVPADFEVPASTGIDEDYIVLTPNEPAMEVRYNDAGWNRNKDRCVTSGYKLFSAPIPQDFIVSKETWDGATPNAGLAVLMADGKTIKQTQPFAHCIKGQPAASQFVFDDETLDGDGVGGAHGASRMSVLGGSLRVGELTPDSGPIRHVLKLNVFGGKNLFYDSEFKGYRWPAVSADGYAGTDPNIGYGTQRTKPVNKDARMGALLAIHPDVDLEKNDLGLKTEPAKIIAKCLQDYGAYVVDDTAWDTKSFDMEWGPAGRFADEFKKNWGFSFSTDGKNDWGKDLIKIFENLYIVVNNTKDSKGGGGTPRQPLAPPFE